MFEVQLDKITRMQYYVKKLVSLDDIPKIKPVILTFVVGESPVSGITGFAIFDTLGISESNKKVFIIEIVAVFVLLGVYLYYYFNSNGTIAPGFSTMQPKPKEGKKESPKASANWRIV